VHQLNAPLPPGAGLAWGTTPLPLVSPGHSIAPLWLKTFSRGV